MAKRLFGVAIVALLLTLPAGTFAQEEQEPEATVALGDVG